MEKLHPSAPWARCARTSLKFSVQCAEWLGSKVQERSCKVAFLLALAFSAYRLGEWLGADWAVPAEDIWTSHTPLQLGVVAEKIARAQLQSGISTSASFFCLTTGRCQQKIYGEATFLSTLGMMCLNLYETLCAMCRVSRWGEKSKSAAAKWHFH
eukprot:g15218.t1